MVKTDHVNTYQKKAGVATLILLNHRFQRKNITRKKESFYYDKGVNSSRAYSDLKCLYT